jgi:hypothetical protein
MRSGQAASAAAARARLAATSARGDHRGRLIGPVGTASRVAIGVAAIVLAGYRGDLTWWDGAAAVAGFPLVAAIALPALRGARTRLFTAATAPGGPRRYVVSVVVVAFAVGLTFATPADAPAVWLWIGVSLLLAAARGDAGCEVLAVANLLTGRRESVGCMLFTPIDAAESRRRDVPPRTASGP